MELLEKQQLEKLSLKKLRELFSIAVYGEHYAIDAANYDRANSHAYNAVVLADVIGDRKTANAKKRIEKYRLEIDKLDRTIGGTGIAERDQIEKLEKKIKELEWDLR